MMKGNNFSSLRRLQQPLDQARATKDSATIMRKQSKRRARLPFPFKDSPAQSGVLIQHTRRGAAGVERYRGESEGA
jgi:hypothetical protein